MHFVDFEAVRERLQGQRVAVVGSGPSVLENDPGFIDAHDVVVRVNNYKTGRAAGYRTDVHYSFYGTSIRKTAEELRRDGVTLCICKCTDSRPIESEWHVRMGRLAGIDFRYIYKNRAAFWFCDTYVPDDARFLAKFELLGRHIPTTGFAAILDVLDCNPSSAYLTGFDFFGSKLHNVDETWRPGHPDDPICHLPQREAAWLRENKGRHPVILDAALTDLLETGECHA